MIRNGVARWLEIKQLVSDGPDLDIEVQVHAYQAHIDETKVPPALTYSPDPRPAIANVKLRDGSRILSASGANATNTKAVVRGLEAIGHLEFDSPMSLHAAPRRSRRL